MKKITLFLFVLITVIGRAQNQNRKGSGSVYGVVRDSVTKKPLEYVSVKVLSLPDSNLVTGIYTDEKGVFDIEPLPYGKYFLKFSLLNYKKMSSENFVLNGENSVRIFSDFRLISEKITDVEEVKVIANRELLSASFDKKIYAISDDISSRGGSVNDALKNVPSVDVDQDGKISLRGDGNVTILIDGRPSTISGSAGKSMLDALPSSMVERIEIVTTPSSKYDPDGTSGIINIVLKKNKLRGINGNVTTNMATNDIYNASTSLSLRNAKWNVYGTYAFRHYEGERNNFSDLSRTVKGTFFGLNQSRLGTDFNEGHTVKFGTDFNFKDRNTLGFSYTGTKGERNRKGNLINNQLTSTNELIRQWERSSYDPSNQFNNEINLNYKNEFKEERGFITFDVTYSAGEDTTGGKYRETTNIPSLFLNQQLSSLEKNDVTTGMIDFVRVFPKNIRIETGIKTIIRNQNIESHSETMRPTESLFKKDSLSNFTYNYKENINSFYGNFAQQLGKFKYQVGSRIENSSQIPNLVSENKTYSRTYFNLFPSAFLTYSFTKENEITMSYSKRINRPSSETLNPFTSYSDPYNLRRGNPEVSPEFIDSYELGYVLSKKKISMSMNVYYRATNNVLQRFRSYDSLGYSAVTYTNIDRSESVGAEWVVTYRPIPLFRNVLSFNANHINYFDANTTLQMNNGVFWSMKYIGAFEFWKRTASIQINAKYNAPIVTVQGTVQPRPSIDFSTEKQFKEGKWVVGLRLSDVFNTQEFRIHVDQPTVQQTSVFKQTKRRVYVNLSYKFGKMDVVKKSKIANEQGGGGGDF